MDPQEKAEDPTESTSPRAAFWQALFTAASVALMAGGILLYLRVTSFEKWLTFLGLILVLAVLLQLVIFPYLKGGDRFQSARRRHLADSIFFVVTAVLYLIVIVRKMKSSPDSWPLLIFAAAFLLKGLDHLRRACTMKKTDLSTTS